MNEALRRSAAHVFVESLAAPVLDPLDIHHLLRVLRVGTRDVVTVSDGRGAWTTAVLEPDGVVRLTGAPVHVEQADPVGVATALVKGDRTELIVQKLTELGVDRIWFFASSRSVVRWDDERGARHVARLRRIAREAAMQSRSVWAPEVDLVGWGRVVAESGAVLAEPGATGRIDAAVRLVVVGPEGGFTPDELACGLPGVTLGDQVLRVETASIAAGVLLTAARCWPG